jgi:nicotinamide mononucleotide adenylyltransferase
MYIAELFETKQAAFCFGRMNPPTLGHKQLLDTVAQAAQDYYIFVSQSQDAKKKSTGLRNQDTIS